MFWLGLLLAVCYVPGYTGASVPTQWAVLSIILPLSLWSGPFSSLGHKLLLGLVAYAIIGLAWSHNLYSSVWGLWFLFIWVMAYHWGTVCNDLSWLWKGLAIGLCASTFLAILQAFDYEFVDVGDPTRPAGLLYNSSLLGVTIGLVLVGLASRRLWWYMPPLALGLILSGSRGGIVILAVGLIARFGGALAAASAVAIGALSFVAIYDPADAQRLQVWGVTLRALTFWGHGAGSFIDLHYLWHAKTLVIRPEYVHNDPLQLIYEFGIFAALPITLFGLALTNRSHPDWPVAVAGATLALFYFPLYTPITALVLLLLAGSMLRDRSLSWGDLHRWRSRLLPWPSHPRPTPDPTRRQALPLVP